jgi:hypothetical protein
MSPVGQTAPLMVEMKGFKLHHFLGDKTALTGGRKALGLGHVQRSCRESSTSHQKFTSEGMVEPAHRA